MMKTLYKGIFIIEIWEEEEIIFLLNPNAVKVCIKITNGNN